MQRVTKSNKRRKTRRKPSPKRRTCSIPEAGEVLGLSRDAAYDAAKRKPPRDLYGADRPAKARSAGVAQ